MEACITNQTIFSHERETIATGTHELHYIAAGDGLAAIYVKFDTGADSLFYIMQDHLGSLVGAINAESDHVYRQSFDAWGRKRNYEDWTYTNVQDEFPFLRGYTGHEHLKWFGLINMNGRMYDASLCRFLSPDPYVQMPENSQNFNRYSYCLNNPLVYTDPSGELFQIFPILFFSGSFLTDFTSNLINGVHNPLGTAYSNVTNTINGLNSCTQVSFYNDESTSISAGFSPLSLGISFNVSHKSGNTTFSASGGFGFGGWYAGGGASYSTDGYEFGINAGGGENHFGVGINASHNGYGAGYYLTQYGDAVGPDGKSNKQLVGGANVFLGDVSLRMENDFFARRHEDRWRSNALEVSINEFSIGTYLYNNDPKNTDGIDAWSKDILSPLWGENRGQNYGGWDNGQTYFSPLYVGYRVGNTVSRMGYSAPVFQDATQNFIHKWFGRGRQHFYANYDYFKKGFYGYSGWVNPFSIWGK